MSGLNSDSEEVHEEVEKEVQEEIIKENIDEVEEEVREEVIEEFIHEAYKEVQEEKSEDQDREEGSDLETEDQAAGMNAKKTVEKSLSVNQEDLNKKKSQTPTCSIGTQYEDQDFMPKKLSTINKLLIEQLLTYYNLDIDVRDNFRTINKVDETVTDAEILFIGFIEALQSFPEEQKMMAKIIILGMLQEKDSIILDNIQHYYGT